MVLEVTEHAVVIAGGGPAGMMLAAELALAKVDVAVVERRPDHVLAGSRAGGFHSRTIEVLDQRGVADRFLAEGQAAQAATFGTTVMDMSDFPTRHPYSLGIWQNQIERIMAAWIAELPVRIYYGCEVTGFAQDDTGVDVELSDGQSLRAAYLVGCDGGRSLVRKAAGIEFPGWDPTTSALLAEVEAGQGGRTVGPRAGEQVARLVGPGDDLRLRHAQLEALARGDRAGRAVGLVLTGRARRRATHRPPARRARGRRHRRPGDLLDFRPAEDGEFGRGRTLFALAQGVWDSPFEGTPALPNTSPRNSLAPLITSGCP